MVLSLEEERRKSVFTYKEKEFFAWLIKLKQAIKRIRRALALCEVLLICFTKSVYCPELISSSFSFR